MDPSDTARRFLSDVSHRVRTNGWTMICTPFDGLPVLYGYTVGFERTFAHPEAVVVGLPPEIIAYVLSRLAGRLGRGERPPRNEPVDLDLNHPVVLRTIAADISAERLKVAHALQDGRVPVEAVQVVWPDPAGRFPWEAGYRLLRGYQPLLYQVPAPD